MQDYRIQVQSQRESILSRAIYPCTRLLLIRWLTLLNVKITLSIVLESDIIDPNSDIQDTLAQQQTSMQQERLIMPIGRNPFKNTSKNLITKKRKRKSSIRKTTNEELLLESTLQPFSQSTVPLETNQYIEYKNPILETLSS